MRTYHVYILANPSRRLYVGVTGDLFKRVWQHRYGSTPGFAKRYGITQLVYHESTSSPRSAIAREKEIKSWHRHRKVRLIESTNEGWIDLAAFWYDEGPAHGRGRSATRD